MSWTETASLFVGLAIFNLISCLPLLLFSSARRLFDALPSEKLVLDYFIGMGGFTVLQSILLVTVIIVRGGLEGIEALWGLGLVSTGTALIAWITASFVFPSLNWWDPKENDELDGRIALGIGLLWYMISTGVGLVLLMMVLIAFFFPG